MARDRDDFRDELRLAFGDSADTPTILVGDALLNGWIEEAFREFSKLSPRRTVEDYAVVAGVQRYTAPAGLISVTEGAIVHSDGRESPVLAVYEPHIGKVAFPTAASRVGTGSTLRAYVNLQHDLPDDSTASTTLDEADEPAIMAYLRYRARTYVATKVSASNGGVSKFTRGRYQQDGTAAAKQLREDAAADLEEFRRLAGDAGGVIESRDNSDLPEGRMPSLTGGRITKFGWDGGSSLSGMDHFGPGGDS
jgi:hypothetical protein